MKKKLFRWMCLVLSLSILATSLFIHIALYISFTRQMKAEMAEETALIADVVEEMNTAGLGEYLDQKLDKRITLIDAHGQVIYDSMGDFAKMENHFDRPEIQAAIKTGKGEDTRFSSTIHSETWYYAVRLKDGEILRLAKTTASLWASILHFLPLTIGIVLAVLVLMLTLASRITKRIVAPINAIALENPEAAEVYEELAPLITTIQKQNKTIEAQMRAMRAKQVEFSAITDNMQEGVIVLDQKANMLSFNKSALSLLDMEPEGTAERNFLAFRREPAFRNLLAAGRQGTAGDVIVKQSGSDLQLYLNPVREDGIVTGAVLLIVDITERQAREKLRREFTANVSHELRTPLTSISGYAEIIMNGIANQADIPGFSRKIYHEAQRLISLIGDILRLSRLDETQQAAPLQMIDLSALCEEVAQRISALAAKQDVTVETDFSPCEIYGVFSALDELVFNLCENAVKYNRPGGKVQIQLRRTQQEILLKVTDTGVGIPKAEQRRVFERFYRVDKSRQSSEGTGLGLSIAKHAALLHQAKISLTSEEGVGTAVEVRFPGIQRIQE